MGLFFSLLSSGLFFWVAVSSFFYCLSLFFFIFGLFFFNKSLPRRKQPLIPLFFSGLFFLLGYVPELAWLEKWIEGIDLLLLALSVFSFIEDAKLNKKAKLRERTHFDCYTKRNDRN